MGIVSSTFASLAIRFAWNCQRFLDPRYRYIENTGAKQGADEMAAAPMNYKMAAKKIVDCGAGIVLAAPSTMKLTNHEHRQVATAICFPAEKHNSLHQENRHRRAAQHRYRKRPSSFDVSLIIRNKNKAYNTTTSGLVTNSTPSTLMRQPVPSWDTDSTSGSSTNSSDDSEIEFMYARKEDAPSNERLEEKLPIQSEDTRNKNHKQEFKETRSLDENNPPEEFSMSPAEEAAFRMTIGRGHFSRSKKDRFLNNLRLEKRLNGLNKEFFEFACRAHTRSTERRHSGDLRRIV